MDEHDDEVEQCPNGCGPMVLNRFGYWICDVCDGAWPADTGVE